MPSCSTMPSASTPSPVLPTEFGLQMGEDVHPGRIEPDEERLLVLVGAVDEVERSVEELPVHGLHPLLGDRASVLALLLAPRSEARVVAGGLGRGRHAFKHAARAEILGEVRILRRLRIVRVFGLFLGVEVIEVAEELVEAVHGRQELVAVAEVVLAELAGHVALGFEQFGERRVLVREALLRRRQPDLEQAGADRALASDEGGAAGGTGLLRVIVGEDRAFVGDPVDVGRAIAHHAAVVGADVPVADVVAHDDEDVGLLRLSLGRADQRQRRQGRSRNAIFQAECHFAPRRCPIRPAGCYTK